MTFDVRMVEQGFTCNVKMGSASPSMDARIEDVQIVTTSSAEPYEGEYEVTPSLETQTLLTENKRMIRNVVINPIPSNYGLITWNGAILTVS